MAIIYIVNLPPKCRSWQLCHSREPSPMAPPVLPGDDNIDHNDDDNLDVNDDDHTKTVINRPLSLAW